MEVVKSHHLQKFEFDWLYCAPGPFHGPCPEDNSEFKYSNMSHYSSVAIASVAAWREREKDCVQEFILGRPRQRRFFKEEGWSDEDAPHAMSLRQALSKALESAWEWECYWWPYELRNYLSIFEAGNSSEPDDVAELYAVLSRDQVDERIISHWDWRALAQTEHGRAACGDAFELFDCGHDDFHRWMDGDSRDTWHFKYPFRIANDEQREAWLPQYQEWQKASKAADIVQSDSGLEDWLSSAQIEFADSRLDFFCAARWDDIRFRRLYRWRLDPSGLLNFVCEAFQAGMRLWSHRVSSVPVPCQNRKDFEALDNLAKLVLNNCRAAFTAEAPSSLLGRDDQTIVRWMYPLIADSAIPGELLSSTDEDVSPILQRVQEYEEGLEEVDNELCIDRECRVIGQRLVTRAIEEASRFGRRLFESIPPIRNELEALDLVHRVVDDCLVNLDPEAIAISPPADRQIAKPPVSISVLASAVEVDSEVVTQFVTVEQVASFVHLEPGSMTRYIRKWPAPTIPKRGRRRAMYDKAKLLPVLREQFPDPSVNWDRF